MVNLRKNISGLPQDGEIRSPQVPITYPSLSSLSKIQLPSISNSHALSREGLQYICNILCVFETIYYQSVFGVCVLIKPIISSLDATGVGTTRLRECLKGYLCNKEGRHFMTCMVSAMHQAIFDTCSKQTIHFW
jgi:hypothetical protein